jgi:hypothetical protein
MYKIVKIVSEQVLTEVRYKDLVEGFSHEVKQE